MFTERMLRGENEPVVSYQYPFSDRAVVFDVDHVQHYPVQVQALT